MPIKDTGELKVFFFKYGSCNIPNVLFDSNIEVVFELWMFIYFLVFRWGKYKKTDLHICPSRIAKGN